MNSLQRQKWINEASAEELVLLSQSWGVWARDKQLPPQGDWRIWLLLAGRGFGKTRAGAQWIHEIAAAQSHLQIALVGATFDDVRHVMVEEVELLFETDFKLAKHILNIWLSEWQNYPASVQMALLSMAFNLGGPRLAGFVKMRTALVDHDYDEAARQALDSRWAKQVGRRAEEIAKLLADGTS